MSIFDKLKSTLSGGAGKTFDKSKSEETFTFTALPESLDELKALPEASLDDPFKTAALSLCALCAYGADKAVGTEMLNWLRGPKGDMTPTEQQFLKDRFADGHFYIPFSYFDGAKPENDYTPSIPFTVKICTNPYSYQNEGYASLYLTSGGAESPRSFTLRKV
ncbi:MAG: hypothetical protein J5832_05360, partial [Clostridia bacterium]|nr:hypothetical protein [Clostridia bacterium]